MVQLNLVKSFFFLILCLSAQFCFAGGKGMSGGRTGVGGGMTPKSDVRYLLLTAWTVYEEAAKEDGVTLLPMSRVVSVSNLLHANLAGDVDLEIILSGADWNKMDVYQRISHLIMESAMLGTKSKEDAELISLEFIGWLYKNPPVALYLSRIMVGKI